MDFDFEAIFSALINFIKALFAAIADFDASTKFNWNWLKPVYEGDGDDDDDVIDDDDDTL